MERTRLSIAGLMAIVGFIALGFAALKNASALWASVLFMVMLGFLSAALLGAVARRGAARTTWAGVAIFGWVYLGIVFGPLRNGNGTTIPALPTMLLYEYILNNDLRKQTNVRVINTLQSETILDKESGKTPKGKPPRASRTLDVMEFKRIVHTIGAVLFALIGGGLGRSFASRDGRTDR